MVPPVADHVTAILAVPVTVAVNCCVPPVNRVIVEGDTLTDTAGAELIVMAAVADLVGSCTLVAFTWNEPVVAPAVYSPPFVTAPPVAVQVTAVLLMPVTVAVNCCVPPGTNVAELGDTEIAVIGAAVTVTVVIAVTDPPALAAVKV